MSLAKRVGTQVGPLAQGGMVSAWGASSMVRSVQRGTISIGPAAATNTATIAAVNMDNSVLRWLSGNYNTDGAVDERDGWSYLTFTNATTITATRQGTNNTATVSFEVIEFMPGIIRSVQRGTIALTAAASNTATVTTVDTNKAVLDYLGTLSGDGFGYSARYLIRLVLTNSTTITATRGNATNNMLVAYQLVEFF